HFETIERRRAAIEQLLHFTRDAKQVGIVGLNGLYSDPLRTNNEGNLLASFRLAYSNTISCNPEVSKRALHIDTVVVDISNLTGDQVCIPDEAGNVLRRR